MKKCYIAGPVTGTIDFKERFAAAEQEVLKMGFTPVSPVRLPHQHDKQWESYMRECVRVMMDCDAVYVLKGYRKSRGAKVEVGIAKLFLYQILFQ